MSPKPVLIDRKELKPSLSESDATIVCKDMPSTPSSCRCPGRPFSGQGRVLVRSEKRLSSNGKFNSHVDFVNSWEQLNSGGGGVGVGTTGEKRGLEKGNSLGSSGLDWKPVVGRGGSFLQPPVGKAAACVTPNAPDYASSRKKPRLVWGEGLAKYEKKKVDPDDIVDKEVGFSSSEPLMPSPSNVSAAGSPSRMGYSECASPTTPCSSTAMDKLHEDHVLLRLLHALLPTDSSDKNTEENSGPTEKADDCVEVLGEHNKVEDLGKESPGTATSKFVESVLLCNRSMNSVTVEPRHSSVNLDIIPEKAECSQDHGGDNMLGVATGSGYTTSVVTVRFVESRELNDCLSASNKATAKSTSDELSNLLPATSRCTRICIDTNVHFFLDGSFSMVPTTEIVEYMNKLLPDSQVRTYMSELKMPSLILDNRERMS
nr:hypothetical protein [Tanacetum cinerariifolium]